MGSTYASTDNSTFVYTASAPKNAGEVEVNVINTSNSPQKLTTITMKGNNNLTSCWGSAMYYSATITGKNGTYTIDNGNNPVSVAANQSVTLTCSATGIAPLAYPMPPQAVSLNGTLANYQTIATKDPGNGYQLVGYFTSWGIYARNYQPTDIPADKINTLVYAFEGFDQNGNVMPDDSYADQVILPQLQQIKLEYPYMKVLIGFGGWQTSTTDPNSPPWSEIAANPTARAAFIKNSIAFMQAVDADGLNIDWEYPVTRESPEGNNPQPIPASQDAQDYANFIVALRQALNTAGAANNKHYLLTIAGPAGAQTIDAIEAADPGDWQTVANNIDYNYLMTYDFHGQFDYNNNPDKDDPSDSAFLSNFRDDPHDPYNPSLNGDGAKFDVQDAVTELASYFKPGQIVVGIPLYGRLESISYSGNEGLFNSLTGNAAKGEWDQPSDPPSTMFDYKCIIDSTYCNGPNKLPTLNYVSYNGDPYAMTPWAYSNQYFMSFDDVNSMAAKADWVKEQHLGGVMFWELSGDVPEQDTSKFNTESLINAAQQTLSNN